MTDGEAKKHPQRRYSVQEKAEALAVVAEYGAEPGAVAYAARRLGIPPRTVAGWVERHRDEILASITSVNAELLPRLWDLQHALLKRLEETIPNLSGRDAVIAYGVLADKAAQAWSGPPGGVTVGIQINVPRPAEGETWSLPPDD